MAFLDDRYLLTGDTAVGLFESIKELPLIDPHNHADVREIRDNRNFADLWQVEAAADHYVWELMRKRGVPEKLITGDAPNRDKWMALAEIFDELAGNPTYEWIHLDLKRRLGLDQVISADSGLAIWEAANQILARPEMKPQALLEAMKVEVVGSTDDPLDDLEPHRALAAAGGYTKIHPTFRPDKAMNIFKPDWLAYIHRLEERFGGKFKNLADLLDALRQAHDYFAANGCLASDHGVEVPYAYPVETDDANAIFKKAYAGKPLDEDETIGFLSYMLNEVAEFDADKDFVFQLHLGCVRDVRDTLKQGIGADSGGDISDHMIDIVAPLAPLLNRFDGRLKIVLYSLDPNQQTTLAALCRAFGQQVNLGSAWWLNDSPIGMRRQLEYVGSVDLLANLAGMVSDSRKLLSYGSRHEMFRRTLADVVGTLVDRGQVPLRVAEKLVANLAYQRPKTLFGF